MLVNNYAKVAARNLLRSKGTTVIMVAGLAVGIACCILILRLVQHELSYDRFHDKADRIFRIVTAEQKGDLENVRAHAHLPLVNALGAIAEIEEVVTLGGAGTLRVRSPNGDFYQEGIATASESFFDVFTFPLTSGHPATALRDPYTIVLSQDLARKFFPRSSAVGQVLTVEDVDYTVTGVFEALPSNSHVSFEALRSQVTNEAIYRARFGERAESLLNRWGMLTYAYILLDERADAESVVQQLESVVLSIRPENENPTYSFSLQPLTEIHLHSQLLGEWQAPGNIRVLYILVTVAFLIVLLASINFINLTTARSTTRAREIGIRKVVGAQRRQIIAQQLAESLLITFLSTLVAVLLAWVLLPSFNELVGRSLALAYQTNLFLVLALGLLCLLIGLLAGIYPALVLSAFKPVHVLAGPTRFGGSSLLRRGLVVAQVAVAIVFIGASLIIVDQLSYIESKNLGFSKDHIITVPVRDPLRFAEQYSVLKEELLQDPRIQSITASMGQPGLWAPDYTLAAEEGEFEEAITYHWLGVDFDFLDVFDIELVSGRDLSPVFGQDASESILLNETAVQVLGWEQPLGRELNLGLNDRRGRVVGVVKDFHHRSLRESIAPMVMYMVPPVFYSTMSVRAQPGTERHVLDVLNAKWDQIYPDYPFQYEFLDEQFVQAHDADRRLGVVAGYASILAVLMSCFGLYGLIAYTVQRRMKEIGIRKVLGASASNVITLISREYLALIGVAFLVAAPLVYVALHEWLNDFAYSVGVSLPMIVLAGCVVTLIGALTVSYHALQAARSNPVTSLQCD